MLASVAAALRAVNDPALKRLFWGSIAASAALLGMFAAAGAYGLGFLPELRWHWLTQIVELLAGAGLVFGLVVLAYPVAAIVISVVLEGVAAKVEARDFPGEPPGRDLGLWKSLGMALPFLGAVVGLNLLALPLYLVLPGANVVLFFLVNGYLVGREYFEMVAFRHASMESVRRLRRTYRLRVILAGVIIALTLSIPVLNLLAPIFGTALMVHVYKDLAARSAG